jgi:hypothetical protein
MTMRVTMRQTRMGEAGSLLQAGSTYTGTPTKVQDQGQMTLTVRAVGGTRRVLLRGDLVA